jgi:hypothetical protein
MKNTNNQKKKIEKVYLSIYFKMKCIFQHRILTQHRMSFKLFCAVKQITICC